MKADIYNAVSTVNGNFDGILAALKSLHEQGVITADYLQEQIELAEELRAGINTMVMGKRHDKEAEDWYHFGSLRKTTEERHRGEGIKGNLPPVESRQG